jgi:hypothetical protein
VLYACEQFPVEHFVQFELTLAAAHDVAAAAVHVEFDLLYLKIDDTAGHTADEGMVPGFRVPSERLKV